MAQHAVVVGASLSGLRVAEQLRSQGWPGTVTVVGAEGHLPYNRPPLSKAVLRGRSDSGDAATVALPLRRSVADVTWRLGTRAVAASLDDRVVALDDGSRVGYDALVVATGLRPRRIPGSVGWASRHAVRTLDDAVRLRGALHVGARVVVVGGGFVGCEVAASARQLGCEVTVVEPAPEPMSLSLARPLAAAIRRHHEARGVAFHLGRVVQVMQPDGNDQQRLRSIVLDDGTELPVDVLVESFGSHPNVEWLQNNDLDLRDGVSCDNRLRVEGRFDIVGVGDVARFPNPLFDNVPRRIEHWSNASETAKQAAVTLVADAAGIDIAEAQQPFGPVPSFWSDQFDLRIQGFGLLGVGDRWETLEGNIDADESLTRGVAMGSFQGQRLVTVVLTGLPAVRGLHYRTQIMTGAPVLAGAGT